MIRCTCGQVLGSIDEACPVCLPGFYAPKTSPVTPDLPDVATLIQRAQGIAPSMHFCEWRGLAEQALALLAARLPTGQLQPIGDEWRDAINSARGLCESEANKWEKQAPGTSKHWRSVAIRLGALWLTSDHVGVAHVEDYNVLVAERVAERDALRAEVAAQREMKFKADTALNRISANHDELSRRLTAETTKAVKAEAALAAQREALQQAQKEAKALRLERLIKRAGSRPGFDAQFELAKQWAEEQQTITAERDALRAEVAAQREALTQLRNYVRHEDDCDTWATRRIGECTCGLAAALAASPEGAR